MIAKLLGKIRCRAKRRMLRHWEKDGQESLVLYSLLTYNDRDYQYSAWELKQWAMEYLETSVDQHARAHAWDILREKVPTDLITAEDREKLRKIARWERGDAIFPASMACHAHGIPWEWRDYGGLR